MSGLRAQRGGLSLGLDLGVSESSRFLIRKARALSTRGFLIGPLAPDSIQTERQLTSATNTHDHLATAET